MRTDGRTDRNYEKPTVAFLHFENAPYKLAEHKQYNDRGNTKSSNWSIDNVQGDF
jgi:hypothetical protein